MKEYQALEWAKNAATLSHHYTVHERFREAKIHLAASEYVIGRYTKDLETKEFECEEDRSEANEVVAQISADVAKSWGKFALVLLEASVEAADREAHPPCESHVIQTKFYLVRNKIRSHTKKERNSMFCICLMAFDDVYGLFCMHNMYFIHSNKHKAGNRRNI